MTTEGEGARQQVSFCPPAESPWQTYSPHQASTRPWFAAAALNKAIPRSWTPHKSQQARVNSTFLDTLSFRITNCPVSYQTTRSRIQVWESRARASKRSGLTSTDQLSRRPGQARLSLSSLTRCRLPANSPLLPLSRHTQYGSLSLSLPYFHSYIANGPSSRATQRSGQNAARASCRPRSYRRPTDRSRLQQAVLVQN